MNPYEIGKLVKQHTSEIRSTAQQHPARAAARRELHRSIRHQAGWALIKLGLTVMPTAKGGPGMTAARPRLSHSHPAP